MPQQETQGPVEGIVAYQGMKLAQMQDRIAQLEQVVIKMSNMTTENTRRMVEEITALKAHTNYVPPESRVGDSASNIPGGPPPQAASGNSGVGSESHC